MFIGDGTFAVKSTDSIFMLGHDIRDEAAVSELLGGPAACFFALAQRIMWGVSQSDLVRVNVAAARAAVVKKFGGARRRTSSMPMPVWPAGAESWLKPLVRTRRPSPRGIRSPGSARPMPSGLARFLSRHWKK